MVRLAGGDLWRIRSDGKTENLTNGFTPAISSIVWPAEPTDIATPLTGIVVGVGRGVATDLFLVGLPSGTMTPLPKPRPEASLAEYAPGVRTVAFTAQTRDGTYLWLSRDAGAAVTVVLKANTFLRQIAEGRIEEIEYRSLDGRSLKAWLLLPINYRRGREYPVVTSVYASFVVSGRPPSRLYINDGHPLNLQLLASHGYAVLVPQHSARALGNGGRPLPEIIGRRSPGSRQGGRIGIR